MHNWLARRLDAEGIGYRLADNAFVEIKDFDAAQQIVDGFDPGRLHRKLETWTRLYCPALTVATSTIRVRPERG